MKSFALLICLLGVGRLSAQDYYFSPQVFQPAPDTAVDKFSSYVSPLAAASPIPARALLSTSTSSASVCLACTCNVGRKTCREAGGIAYWSSGETAIGQGGAVICDTSGCAIEAPATMSACDPICKKRTATCDYNVTPSQLRCTQDVDTSVCGTNCEYRAAGEKVVCNQQDIAKGVTKGLPSGVCTVFGRKRREAGKAKRQGNYYYNSAPFGRFFALQTSVANVGSTVFPYAPTGSCIPSNFAYAPLCTRLD